MKKLLIFCLPIIFLCSCQRNTSETWEDVKTAGRYMKQSFMALLGKDQGESRLLASDDEFQGPFEEDFIPLEDSDLSHSQVSFEKTLSQPKKSTRELLGSVPNMDEFFTPPASLRNVFRVMHFETDNHVIKDHDDLVTVARVANYMKKHPNAYIVIEGHCDQRASADYNLALGMRRAQHIRVLLSQQGVNPERLYTVSYGKEKPASLGKSSHDLFMNRRAEFKLFLKEES